MHEYAMVEALLEAAQSHADAANARSVRKLVVSVGALSGLDAELFQLAFDTFRERTICDGATLEIAPVPARWACSDCDAPLTGPRAVCDACGGRARLAGGDDVTLSRIEMEVD